MCDFIHLVSCDDDDHDKLLSLSTFNTLFVGIKLQWYSVVVYLCLFLHLAYTLSRNRNGITVG